MHKLNPECKETLGPTNCSNLCNTIEIICSLHDAFETRCFLIKCNLRGRSFFCNWDASWWDVFCAAKSILLLTYTDRFQSLHLPTKYSHSTTEIAKSYMLNPGNKLPINCGLIAALICWRTLQNDCIRWKNWIHHLHALLTAWDYKKSKKTYLMLFLPFHNLFKFAALMFSVCMIDQLENIAWL